MNNKLKCILIIDDDEPTNFFTSLFPEDKLRAKKCQNIFQMLLHKLW